MNVKLVIFIFLIILPVYQMNTLQTGRCRDCGIHPGTLNPGQFNAITDVAGVTVGSVTVTNLAGVNTGVTIIMPHPGIFLRKSSMPAYMSETVLGRQSDFCRLKNLAPLNPPLP